MQEQGEKWNVGILIFDNVEVLDFTGPYEVFSRTRTQPGVESRRTEETAPFRVFTVAAGSGNSAADHQEGEESQQGKKLTVVATGGLRVLADYDMQSAPKIDLLVVPGGFGTRPLLERDDVLAWIKTTASDAKLVSSVCTGAMLLAKAGMLDDKETTTHWASLSWLAENFPMVKVDRELRWVDAGDVVSSAGVAAGIDMAFHIVERICGKEVANDTAHYIEYPRRLATDPRSSKTAA